MVLPVLATAATRVASAGKASAQAKKVSSLQQETLRRAAELNSSRRRDQEREQSQHNYTAQAAERRLRQKVTGKALTLLTGGMGLPLGFFGGRIIGTLARGMDLGISDIFKLIFLILGLVVLSPLLIILFLPLSPLIFAFSLVSVIALFAKR
ncbi:MAG: hypothetical protein UU22_C0017G0004 [Parcubacteria group bacterium GW2011_GWA2_40_8]|nr:MAG: hypothetical protein UU22_C0017G0004 [Parcubacteria group bacterium GW2011_GWA2_40_8]